MKKIVFFYPVFLYGSVIAYAQDTIQVPLNNPLQHTIANYTIANPAGLLVQPFGNFRRAELSFTRNSGNFRLPQEERKRCLFNFNTQGIRKFRNWEVYGKFEYNRKLLDSVAWDLNANRDNGTPYYFASPKPGNWDIENYFLKGTVINNSFKKINIGLSADYYANNSARSNDPRPSYTIHAMNFEPFVRFSVKRLGISVGGIYGYGSGSTDISYMNEQENDRPSAANYITYEVLGYGNIRNSIKYQRNFEYKQNTIGANIQVNLNLKNNAIWFRASHVQQNDTTLRNIIDYTDYNNLIGRYRLQKTKLIMGMNGKTRGNHYWNALLTGSYHRGKDALFVTIGGLNSYVYNATNVVFVANITNYHTQLNHSSLGAMIRYNEENKMDGVSQHTFNRKTVYTQLMCNRTVPSLKNNQWVLQGAPGFTLNKSTLQYPSNQENVFTSSVAAPESDFYNTNSFNLETRAGYGKYIKPNQYISLLIYYRIMKPFTNNQLYNLQHEYGLNMNFNF